MLYFTFAIVTLGLTIAAFVFKGISSGMLRIASVIAWVIMIPLSFSQTWSANPASFLPQAVGYFCVGMVIIMVAATIILFVDVSKNNKKLILSSDDIQKEHRKKVYGITHKKHPWE